MKVENKNAHRAANKHYYFATHVRDGDGSGNSCTTINTFHYELSFTYHTTKVVSNVKHKKGAKQ